MNRDRGHSEQPDYVEYLDTPIGVIAIKANAHGLSAVQFVGAAGLANPSAVTTSASAQLDEYFQGERVRFDLPLAPQGTPFQQQVWQALLEVPAGHTSSYADIALAVARPTAVRAVGSANGRNPIAIIIPCHRIIGSNGQLTGYAYGLDIKAWLLRHEGAMPS